MMASTTSRACGAMFLAFTVKAYIIFLDPFSILREALKSWRDSILSNGTEREVQWRAFTLKHKDEHEQHRLRVSSSWLYLH